MRFCDNCGRAMARDASSGSVVFRCECGQEAQGGPHDARVAGSILGTSEVAGMYDRLIRTAPKDRTNQLVQHPCPDCGLDYRTLVRVGSAEVVIFRCKCGRTEVGGAT
jgi:DNA-directed RNA polymerase subunit M/transcription elongation factor TFIIS